MEIKVIKDALQYIEKRINGATDKIVKEIGKIKLEEAEKTVIDLDPVIKELQAIKNKEIKIPVAEKVEIPDNTLVLNAILNAVLSNKPETLREELDAFGKTILTLKPKDEVTINPVQMKGIMSALTGGRGGGIATTDVATESKQDVLIGNYALKLDDTSTANVIYLGKAPMGSAGSDANWQLKKIDQTNGVVIQWADGDANFNNVWDDRISVSYI